MRKLFLLFVLVLTFQSAHAAPAIYDPSTGKYLGNLSSNSYDVNSVNNKYSRFGSEYSPDSIKNPYSKWGSPYSPSSINNPYAQTPPVIIDSDN